jgi:hypothetical protein
MTTTNRLRNILTRYSQIAHPTPRQHAAFEFLWNWLWLSATVYGRTDCFGDFRIRRARLRYAGEVSMERWMRLWGIAA